MYVYFLFVQEQINTSSSMAGHGRCKGGGPESTIIGSPCRCYMFLPHKQVCRELSAENAVRRCDPGWTGEFCETNGIFKNGSCPAGFFGTCGNCNVVCDYETTCSSHGMSVRVCVCVCVCARPATGGMRIFGKDYLHRRGTDLTGRCRGVHELEVCDCGE